VAEIELKLVCQPPEEEEQKQEACNAFIHFRGMCMDNMKAKYLFCSVWFLFAHGKTYVTISVLVKHKNE